MNFIQVSTDLLMSVLINGDFAYKASSVINTGIFAAFMTVPGKAGVTGIQKENWW